MAQRAVTIQYHKPVSTVTMGGSTVKIIFTHHVCMHTHIQYNIHTDNSAFNGTSGI